MIIVNWNVEWASPTSSRTAELLSRIRQHSPDVVCLTEVDDRLLSAEGHAISSRPDYGYSAKEHRRKVLLWSREPWQQVDDVGSDSLPPGRYVSGTTQTDVGEATVVGICIPWSGSRTQVRFGPERKKQWEDHEKFIDELAKILQEAPSNCFVVVGDFNQAMGQRCRPRRELRRLLREAFPPECQIATQDLSFRGKPSIDHIVLSADWDVRSLSAIDNFQEGKRLSDHFGIAADLTVSRAPTVAPSPGA